MDVDTLETMQDPQSAAPARPGHTQTSGSLLCLQAALLSRASLAEAVIAFATELAHTLECERIVIGMAEGGGVLPLAGSDSQVLDPSADATRTLALAMEEALDQQSTLIHPPPASARPWILAAHQRLVRGGVAGVASVPLPCDGRIIGVLTLERRADHFADWEIALLEDAASFAGPILELKRAALAPWWRRLATDAVRRTQSLAQPGNTRARAIAVLAILGILGVAAIPLPHHVSAPARLEGEMQRAIVAPSDGYLRQANVRAGDRVRAGQVLAELAGEDLELERARRESELRQHENAYRTALARSDRAQMVVHQARAGEAQAMLDLVESQIARARISAPFDGVVIKGDLNQQLGAPVARGDVLLTLAPGESFRLVIEVDEADIAEVGIGRRGQLVLTAGPDRSHAFEVTRIVPLATSADGRNFFEVEGTLPGPVAELRPGLRGIARIEAGKRSLWHIATRRAFGWLRLHLWSLTGWSP